MAGEVVAQAKAVAAAVKAGAMKDVRTLAQVEVEKIAVTRRAAVDAIKAKARTIGEDVDTQCKDVKAEAAAVARDYVNKARAAAKQVEAMAMADAQVILENAEAAAKKVAAKAMADAEVVAKQIIQQASAKAGMLFEDACKKAARQAANEKASSADSKAQQELIALHATLNQTKKELDDTKAQQQRELIALQATVDQTKKELDDTKAKQQQELITLRATLDQTKKELDETTVQLDAATISKYSFMKELSEARQGLKHLSAAKYQLEGEGAQARKDYQDAVNELRSGQRGLNNVVKVMKAENDKLKGHDYRQFQQALEQLSRHNQDLQLQLRTVKAEKEALQVKLADVLD